MKKINSNEIFAFKEHLIEEEKSSITVEKYIRDVKAFAFWCKDKELNKKTVLEYKEHIKENYAPKSVNSMISSLNAFFEYKKAYDLKIKTLKIQKQLFLPDEKELTKEEYERLLKAAKEKGNNKLYFIMQTICSCGIRVSELKYITVSAIHSCSASINLKGKIRVVILPKNLCMMLKKYISKEKIKSGSVFISRNGKPLDRSNIWKMLKSLCKVANVAKEKVFPHNLRHLFARTFYTIQKDVVRLADILGHSSINTTRIYTMENGEIHRQQIQNLGLLFCDG